MNFENEPDKPPILAYVICLCMVTLIAIVAILGVELLRPNKDNAQLLTTIVGMLAPTTAMIIALIHNAAGMDRQHRAMNSRLDQLVAAKEAVAKAEGVQEGRLVVTLPMMPVPVQIQQPVGDPVPVVLPKEGTL